jgi:hypothetical protein
MFDGCNGNIKGVGNINIHENSDVKKYHRAIWLSGIFDDLPCVLKFILVFITFAPPSFNLAYTYFVN